jgi:chitin disaccharide deacetylase
MKKEVILVADDFGLDAKINEAILHSHVSGGLQAASLMMAQPGTEEAVTIARTHPELLIGWHFHLNDSHPATLEHWPWGRSPARAGIGIALTRNAREIMRREVIRQWELFQNTGLPCHFVNSHHHLHAHPAVFKTLVEVLGRDFKGWIRLGRVRFFQPALQLFGTSRLVDTFLQRERKLSTWRSTDTLWGLDRLFAMKAHEVRVAVSALPAGFHEFLFHPRTLSCPDTQCLLELKSLPID